MLHNIFIWLNILIMSPQAVSADTTAIFSLPQLPYELGDLAPQISEETMQFHYGKHHQAYIANVNKLIRGTKFKRMSLEEIVKQSDGTLFNNAAQAWNHTFYFLTLSPNPKTVPTGKLSEAINRDFGSFAQLKEQLSKAAVSLFGSGWVWLAVDKTGKLVIVSESNAGTPLRLGLKPLLGIDVWEHAYYIDFRNRRADAVEALWERIDWRTVEERFR